MLQYVCAMRKVSKTRSLTLVLDEFNKRQEGISFVRLAEDLSVEMNRTTVYRILKRLEENETLHSFVGKDGVRWYALNNNETTINSNAHPHFQCEKCGRTECLEVDVNIPQLPNHHVQSVSLLYVGCCEKCIP